ncbi:MAG: MFS transporter [Deltaproteobacteria bacterium]|nr:MFS transporter [Deltaproteobacteria bacterium]
MNSHERRILVVTCFGHFMSHFNMLVFPALLLPLAGRLNMEMTSVLGLSFWMYLLFGITALPWGIAADRWGAKPFLLLFYWGAGLSSLAVALWIDAPVGLSLALAALGLFSGIYHPTGLGLISQEIKRISLGMGYNGIFGNLGLAAAPLITGMINWLWGPRAAYLFLAGLNLFGLLLMFVLPLSEAKKEREVGSGGGNGLLGAFLILLVAMMLGGVAYRGSSVIMPAYFELKNLGIFQWFSSIMGEGLSKNFVATTVTSFIFLVGMLGQYTGGRVAEKYDPRFCYLAFHIATIPAAFLMAIAIDLPLVVLAMVYFFFLLGMQPIENTLVARFTPRRFHHSAYGAKFVLTFGVGALAIKMIKMIETAFTIETVFVALGMVSLALVGVIVLMILRTRSARLDT